MTIESSMTVSEPMMTARAMGNPWKHQLRPQVQAENGDGIVADKGADHEDIAVGEVDQADDAVDHGIAQGDQRIDEAKLQTAEHKLDEQSGVFDSVAGPRYRGRHAAKTSRKALADPGKSCPGPARGKGGSWA